MVLPTRGTRVSASCFNTLINSYAKSKELMGQMVVAAVEAGSRAMASKATAALAWLGLGLRVRVGVGVRVDLGCRALCTHLTHR